MKDSLRTLRGQKFIGTVELADEAARLISQFVPRQERGTVSEVPDERTIRYYISEGLISPPEGRQGASSIYGYLHLLQLLMIKRLQAEHLPIRKIKEVVEGRSESAIERLLEFQKGDDQSERPKNQATEYLESLLKPSKSRRLETPSSAHTAPPQLSASGAARSAWTRVEIEPGLEVHVREDYRLSTDIRDRQRLARTILNEIEKRSYAPRK